MDPYSEELGAYPLSELIPQLFATVRSVEAAYAEYPEAASAVARMSRFLTDERLSLAQRADNDLAAAKRLQRLLYALNELFHPMHDLKFAQASPIAEHELKDLSTPILLLIAHGLSTIDRIEQEHAN